MAFRVLHSLVSFVLALKDFSLILVPSNELEQLPLRNLGLGIIVLAVLALAVCTVENSRRHDTCDLLKLLRLVVMVESLEVDEQVVHLWQVDERLTVSFEAQASSYLVVVHEMAEIDVEEAPFDLVKHEVAAVPVFNAQNVGGNALSSRGLDVGVVHLLEFLVRLLHGLNKQLLVLLIESIPFAVFDGSLALVESSRGGNSSPRGATLLLKSIVVLLEDLGVHLPLEVLVHRPVIERTAEPASPLVHARDHFRLVHKLNEADLPACFHDFVAVHLHVLVVFHPHLVHDSKELQH